MRNCGTLDNFVRTVRYAPLRRLVTGGTVLLSGWAMTELTEARIRVQIARTGIMIWTICGVSVTIAMIIAAAAFASAGVTAGFLSFVAALFAFISYHSAGWGLRFSREAKDALSSLPRYRGDLSGFERNFGYLMHLRNIWQH